MKFTVDAATFATEVAWVARMLPTRTVVPVLTGIRVQASNGYLRLTTFDYDTCAHADVSANVDTAGTVLVPGRVLSAVAAQLPEGQLEVTADNSTIFLESGTARFRLLTLPLEDYPTTPEPVEPAGHVDGALFVSAVGRVAYAAATENTIPHLTGVQLRLNPNEVVLTATDAYRVAQNNLHWAPARDDVEATVLVHHRTLAHAAKTITGQVSLGMEYDDSGAIIGMGVSGGNRHLITRLLDDTPWRDVDRFLNAVDGATITVETARLEQAVRRATAVIQGDTPVTLEFNAEHLMVHGGSGDEASSADTVPLTSHDHDQEYAVAFCPRYLTDVLSAIPTGHTRMVVPGGTKPALFLPDEESSDCRHLVVPRKLFGQAEKKTAA